jgi:hypothetical protein
MKDRHQYRDELIAFFMEHPNESFSRSQLMEALGRKHTTIWGNILQINDMEDFNYVVKSKKVPNVDRTGRKTVHFYLEECK